MGARDDWFRNTSWNAEIAAAFDARLARSRTPANRAQYLRIQAGLLAATHPDVAHRLLDRYFAVGHPFEDAMAHGDRARACLAQGRVAEAVAAYEAALAREAAFPNLQTRAFLDLPRLIAERRLRDLYPRALQLLEAGAGRLTFPVDRYVWNGSFALIAAHQGRRADARAFAKAALEAAAATHSGFVRHPTIGLVTDKDDFHRRVAAAASRWPRLFG